jgi:hypothetical protein
MEGYDRLCARMAEHPELAIFRKFSVVNYRMLLYLQAQLATHEGRLISAIEEDRVSNDPGRQQYAFNFHALLNADRENESVSVQRKLMEEMLPLVATYSRSSTMSLAITGC